MFVSGDPLRSPGPRGEQQQDASFLIWLNNGPDDADVTLPENQWVNHGEVVLSTDTGNPVGAPVAAGDKITLQGRSVLVLRQTCRVEWASSRRVGRFAQLNSERRPTQLSDRAVRPGRARRPRPAGRCGAPRGRCSRRRRSGRGRRCRRSGAGRPRSPRPASSDVDHGVAQLVLAVERAVHELHVDVVGRQLAERHERAHGQLGADLGSLADARALDVLDPDAGPGALDPLLPRRPARPRRRSRC